MGFLSYHLRLYQLELQQLENSPITPERLTRARQLLQILADLTDEGYPELAEQLERTISGPARLRDYLRRAHAAPFPRPSPPPNCGALPYSAQDTELCAAISQAMRAAASAPDTAPVPFTDHLHRFCRWLGYDAQTAYIFLLRDTLLPFVCYSAQGRARIYPWLLSRSSFAALTGRQNADDDLRASIYNALESGCTTPRAFFQAVLPDIRQTITRFPQAKATLSAMLAAIPAERILVVESGCAGTFPLLLMSLDDRVDLRMYTTYPYLTGVYRTRIFTPRYEENRLFETMASQAQYFRFSGLRDGRFYVRTCTDAAVGRQSLQELKQMIPPRIR